ncbi:hypothetical protein [Mammaliicoccus sciuri]|uniref:hypothetical protein n=1 Tax=Mammaliicoccus sciuri TaxID=1296 RepID=UPI002888593E|nr:hypothetical protein [Mammaliicoccus sciuri]MDT0754001.1 hypothetical protein [Mammaliicoccus sciuri]
MTLPIIALIVSVVGLVSSVILHKVNNKSDDKINQASINSVNRKIEYLEKNVQPLIDKHNEEQEQELIEIRQKHWKSFNMWKFQRDNINQDAGDKLTCGACYNDSLELDIEYKFKEDMAYFKTNGGIGYLDVKEDYPLSAEQKCTICGHVAGKWKYEE